VAAFLTEDHAGALMEILTEFAVRGINLSAIQSRPTGDGLGRYVIFIDCEGHIDDARVGEAMMGLRRVCADIRFLGSYPRSDGGRVQVRPGTSDAEYAEAAAWLSGLRYGPALSAQGFIGSDRVALEVGREVLGEQVRQSKVGAGAPVRLLLLVLRGKQAGRQCAAHLLELRAGGHLLREQRGLDAVEEALEPPDQLRLGHPELGLARRVITERQGEALELCHQFGREPVLELLDGVLVDLLQPRPALLVERRRLDLLKELPDHRADPHHLGRLLHHLGNRPLARAAIGFISAAADGHPVRPDDDDLRPARLLRADFLAHTSHAIGCGT
jgi:hypothetical protein